MEPRYNPYPWMAEKEGNIQLYIDNIKLRRHKENHRDPRFFGKWIRTTWSAEALKNLAKQIT